MSHWEERKTSVRDLKHLASAAKELGLTFHGDVKLADNGYGKRKCDAVIRGKSKIHGTTRDWAFEISVEKKEDGTFGLVTDWIYGQSGVVGQDYGKLLQLYGVHATSAACKAKGYMVRRVPKSNGTIQLEVTGMR